MRNLLRIAVLAAMLAACGDSTGTNNGQEGALDVMLNTSTQVVFHVGDRYVFAEHWEAFDGVGTEMSLDSTDARALGLRYSLGDSLAPTAAVDSTGGFKLTQPFIGFLYVFAPTIRASRERLGEHYIDVEP